MTSNPHLTAMDLDLLDLGRASVEDLRRLEVHGQQCPACAARRAEHARHVARFRTVVFSRTVPDVVSRARPAWRWGWSLGLAIPVAAALLVLSHPRHQRTPDTGAMLASPVIGIKGAGQLQVFARRQRGVVPSAHEITRVSDGDRLAAGDALRFVLQPTGLPYVLIASIDGASQPSVYFPFRGEASAEVDGANTVSVPGSIVLDDAPGPERIFAIHSDRPIAASTVREALGRIGAGGADAIRSAQRLPIDNTVQSTVLLEKEQGR